jgi:hypothetical protein
LVSTTPVSGSASLKARAVLTASWPVMLSTTNSVSTGFSAACSAPDLRHHLGVDVQPAGGVHDQHVGNWGAPPPWRRAISTAVLAASLREEVRAHLGASVLQLLDRRRPIHVGS